LRDLKKDDGLCQLLKVTKNTWHCFLLLDGSDNEGISAASFCCQVATLVQDIFYNFYIVKNHKIAKNSATTEDREKNKHKFGILRIF